MSSGRYLTICSEFANIIMFSLPQCPKFAAWASPSLAINLSLRSVVMKHHALVIFRDLKCKGGLRDASAKRAVGATFRICPISSDSDGVACSHRLNDRVPLSGNIVPTYERQRAANRLVPLMLSTIRESGGCA